MTTGLEGLAYPQTVATPGLIAKYPTETFDVTIDWAGEGLLPTADTIAGSVWTPDDGITVASESFSATTTTMWVTGGTAGWVYHVSNTISTAAGRSFYAILRFKVKHRPADWAVP